MKRHLFTAVLIAACAASASAPTEEQEPRYEERAFVNVTTSPFVKILAKEATYVTPALIFMGKYYTGDILRCLHDDPTVCEVLYKAEYSIDSLHVHGEYLYAGLSSGAIIKCELYKTNDSCSYLYEKPGSITSMTSIKGYLYATTFKYILRCDLHRPNDCQVLYTVKEMIHSISYFEDHIYVGCWNGKLFRCSLKNTNSCVEVDDLFQQVTGLAVSGTNLIAITYEGYLWNCSRKVDETRHFCETVSRGSGQMREVVVNNEILYIADFKGLYSCGWEKDANCTIYPNITSHFITKLAYVYSAYQMQDRYKNEHNTCGTRSKCPPFVTYYEPSERTAFEVHVKDGKLWNFFGDLVDTRRADRGKSGPAAIFVMGPDGRILLSNAHVNNLLHTSSLVAGGPVAGAGELIVEDGIIKSMTTCSEHYRPTLDLNRQVVASLRTQGYMEPIDLKDCYEIEIESCGELSKQFIEFSKSRHFTRAFFAC